MRQQGDLGQRGDTQGVDKGQRRLHVARLAGNLHDLSAGAGANGEQGNIFADRLVDGPIEALPIDPDGVDGEAQRLALVG